MPQWSNDGELFTAAKTKLFTAVVGDILDQMGFRHQFLAPQIKILNPDTVVLGRAMPVLEADVYEEHSSSGHWQQGNQSFGIMFEALDSLKENDVYITSGSSPNYALWGGLMSNRAIACKSAGAVLDGYCRDSREILELNFPVCCLGTYAQDQGVRGKVLDFNCAIEFNGIPVRPGDVVFGDRDGTLIVPKEAVEEAFSRAFEKVSTENKVRDAIRQGMSTVEASKTFGVM